MDQIIIRGRRPTRLKIFMKWLPLVSDAGDVRRDQLQVTSSDGAQRMVELAYWYKIPLRSASGEKVRLRDDTLTFVRAVTCFPHLASLILFKKEACAKNGVESVLASEQLPEPMKHVGFCGLVPKNCDPDLMKAYVYAHAAYMVDLGKLVNLDDKRSLKQMVLSQVECSKAGVLYKVPYDDEFRVGILRAVGLTDAVVFKKIVDVCNNVCKVVGEPELDFATAEKNHIKNNMVCFFEEENKDLVAGEHAKALADHKNELLASKD
ncbi:uncharacterized protein LOC143565130 [Bidens hawaiensis]|uniref:uncharacterized protein LOC143565130 n=1 Tax=Bidens hawaiensis TaxID=980011 RepID=UPI00404B1A8A